MYSANSRATTKKSKKKKNKRIIDMLTKDREMKIKLKPKKAVKVWKKEQRTQQQINKSNKHGRYQFNHASNCYKH